MLLFALLVASIGFSHPCLLRFSCCVWCGWGPELRLPRVKRAIFWLDPPGSATMNLLRYLIPFGSGDVGVERHQGTEEEEEPGEPEHARGVDASVVLHVHQRCGQTLKQMNTSKIAEASAESGWTNQTRNSKVFVGGAQPASRNSEPGGLSFCLKRQCQISGQDPKRRGLRHRPTRHHANSTSCKMCVRTMGFEVLSLSREREECIPTKPTPKAVELLELCLGSGKMGLEAAQPTGLFSVRKRFGGLFPQSAF